LDHLQCSLRQQTELLTELRGNPAAWEIGSAPAVREGWPGIRPARIRLIDGQVSKLILMSNWKTKLPT
jgi:hypothetical protein